MEPRIASARILLLIAVILAVAADILLRAIPWGINFSLAAFLLFGGIILLARRMQDPIPLEAWPVMFAGLALAACIAWRDAADLAFFNFLATLAAAALVTARRHRGELARMTFLDHLHQSLVHALHVTAGFGFLLLHDLRGGPGEPRTSRWGRAWLGVALAFPALILFGSLLTSADATFEYVIKEVLRIDFWTVVSHGVLIAFFCWTIGGFLRGRYLATVRTMPEALRPKGLALGVTEIAIVLGALDLLFAAFVAIQIPYFFGGHGTVLGTPSLTYAEYARRGFFELITVASLSLPLLLLAEWLLSTDRPRDIRIFRALSIVMVALLATMLVSGMHRLWLYMDAYGLTTLRLNAAAFLLWLGATLLLFCITVLKGKRKLLPFSMALTGFLVLIGLNTVNPDALVARVNLARMVSDGKFDPQYTLRLSADAVPVLLEAMPAMESEQRSALARQLLNRYAVQPRDQDLRSWNLSRSTARNLVVADEARLRGYLLPADKPDVVSRLP